MILPISLLAFLPVSVLVWGQTLIPPSTFPTLSSTSSGSTTTGASQTSSTSQTSSVNVTASTTSTASFPSLSGYSACVSNCLAVGIARVGCSSVIDVNCFCVNSLFTSELVGCVLAACPGDLSTAENLAQQFCNIASASPSLSFPPVPTTTTPSSSSSSAPLSTATSPAPSSTNTTSAAAHSREGAWIAVAITLLLGFVTCG